MWGRAPSHHGDELYSETGLGAALQLYSYDMHPGPMALAWVCANDRGTTQLWPTKQS